MEATKKNNGMATEGMATENTSKIAEMANAECGVWWGRMQEMVGSVAESRAREWQIASYWDSEEAWEFAWNTASEVLTQEMGEEEYEADPEWDTYTDLLAQTAMEILTDKCRIQTEEMAEQEILNKDPALTVAGRMAELVAGGCDPDEIAQRLTNTYAEWLDIDEGMEEYEMVNRIANKHIDNEMANEEEEYEMETMKRMAVAELEATENTEGMADEEILELALSRATMEWSQLALEWIARKWSCLEDPDGENTDDVAGNIAAWQFGYRCEQEDQPTILLAWALHKENGGFDEDIRREIDDRIQRIANAVANGQQDWFSVVDSLECTEYELQEAHRIFDRKLLGILEEHTIKNAKEILEQIRKDGDEDGIYDELDAAIARCEQGNGTGKDWDLLVDQTTM